MIGVYSETKGDDLYMIGTFLVDGKVVKAEVLGNRFESEKLGKKLADKILNK